MTQQARVSGLVLLRELLQKAGLRDVEREATIFLYRARDKHTMRSIAGGSARFERSRPYSRLIFFEWPVAYGLHPWRAFQILLGLMLLSLVLRLSAGDRPNCAITQAPWRVIYQICAQRPADRRRRLDKARGPTAMCRNNSVRAGCILKSLIGKYRLTPSTSACCPHSTSAGAS